VSANIGSNRYTLPGRPTAGSTLANTMGWIGGIDVVHGIREDLGFFSIAGRNFVNDIFLFIL
jgi:hypothetical protein